MHQIEREDVAKGTKIEYFSCIKMYLCAIKRCNLYHDIMHICFNYIDILMLLREDTT